MYVCRLLHVTNVHVIQVTSILCYFDNSHYAFGESLMEYIYWVWWW